MNFWPEFLASSWGREFVAGGFGGIGGVITGYPLDTIRIWQQQSSKASSAFSILRNVVAAEGPAALYKGMAAPLASVTFQVMFILSTYVSSILILSHSNWSQCMYDFACLGFLDCTDSVNLRSSHGGLVIYTHLRY